MRVSQHVTLEVDGLIEGRGRIKHVVHVGDFACIEVQRLVEAERKLEHRSHANHIARVIKGHRLIEIGGVCKHQTDFSDFSRVGEMNRSVQRS